MGFLSDLTARSQKSFFTLNAGDFASEGRFDGINSSMMVWRRGLYREIYDILIKHYAIITEKMYKFDHYMEILMFNKLSISSCLPPGISSLSSKVEVDLFNCGFLQAHFPDKIRDYMSIKSLLPSSTTVGTVPVPLTNIPSFSSTTTSSSDSSSSSTSSDSSLTTVTTHLHLDAIRIVCFPLYPKPEHLDNNCWLRSHWS